MELLFVTLGGVILGLIARYVLPHRHVHGVVLIPAIGAAAAAVVWGALTWLGLPWDGGWIWVISLVCAGLTAIAADILIGRARIVRDEERLAELLSGRVPVS